MIDRAHPLPFVRQVKVLGISRPSAYYTPSPVSAADLALMRRIDDLHLEHPFAGVHMLMCLLKRKGIAIGRKHVGWLPAGHHRIGCAVHARRKFFDLHANHSSEIAGQAMPYFAAL
jgi:hypothetical protein